MARKKTANKTSKKSAAVRNKSKNVSGNDLKKNINLIVSNLLLFVALFLVSLILYSFLGNDFLKSLFQVMTMVFGFVSVAFLITFLVLIIMKLVSKKK
jgi:hypothetical protein